MLSKKYFIKVELRNNINFTYNAQLGVEKCENYRLALCLQA